MQKVNDIRQQAFTPYKLQSEKKQDKGRTFTVWMSDAEFAQLERDMAFIEEPKPSTALKQLAKIGSNLLGEGSTACAISTLFKNKKRRERY